MMKCFYLLQRPFTPANEDMSSFGKKKGLEIWRVNKFELEPVPKEEYGKFYSGDAYVCLHKNEDEEWNIHFWLGEHSTTDEMGTAAIKTVEIDQALADQPIQHREIQNHESSLFLSYFPEGIRYLNGGYESGYHHVEDMYENWKPRLFHCKGKRNVRCTEVECRSESLNLGDVFILDLGRELYVWAPPESGRLERIKGMECARNIAFVERHGKAEVHILDSDWDQDETFWSHFGGTSALENIDKAKNDDENYWKRTSEQITLYRVTGTSGAIEVTKVAQGHISMSDLDTNFAESLPSERQKRMRKWMEYLISAVQISEHFFVQGKTKVDGVMKRIYEVSECDGFCSPPQWIYQSRTQPLFLLTYSTIAITKMFTHAEHFLIKDAFILDAVNGGIFVWIGKECNIGERRNALLWGENYLKQQNLPPWTQVTSVLEGVEPTSFAQWFGEWQEGRKRRAFDPRLFQVSDNMGKLVVEEITNFDQKSLDGDDVMILDALHSVYVWIGAGANPEEKEEAENTAKKYLEQGALPRQNDPTIDIIHQGEETPAFKKFFRDWDDDLFQSDGRSVESIKKLLFNQ